MRPHGKTKLGFFPLPVPEATRLKNCLAFASEFSALPVKNRALQALDEIPHLSYIPPQLVKRERVRQLARGF
jgi:hypothetical protein